MAHASLTVAQSMAAGIAFVHQELNLFDNLDVAANVYIGREPRKYGFLQLVDNDKLHKTVQPFLDRLGATFSPDDAGGAALARRSSRSSRSPRR